MKGLRDIADYRYTNGPHTVKVRKDSDQGGSPSIAQAVCSCGWSGEKYDEYYYVRPTDKAWWTGPTDALREALQHAGYDPTVEAAKANEAVAKNLAAIASFTEESTRILHEQQFYATVLLGKDVV